MSGNLKLNIYATGQQKDMVRILAAIECLFPIGQCEAYSRSFSATTERLGVINCNLAPKYIFSNIGSLRQRFPKVTFYIQIEPLLGDLTVY